MLQLFSGLQRSLIVLISFLFVIYFADTYAEYWQEKILFIEQALPVLIFTTAILSSYFNRSRLTIAMMVLAVYYASIIEIVPLLSWGKQNEEWCLLFYSFALVFLAYSKDRSLVSIHGLYKLIFITALAIFTHYWFIVVQSQMPRLNEISVLAPWLHLITLKLPLALSLLLLVWRMLREKSLVVVALLSTHLIWVAKAYLFTNLPLTVILTLVALLYLVAILVDSYFLAYRDELTLLPSRRALNQLSLSLGRKYTVAMLDIDHFKKFNDTYGHDIGDQVLKLVATKLAKVGGGGKVFRYGGEEFTVVFPRKTIAQAMPVLESVRQSIQDYKIVIRQPQRKTKKSRKSGDAKSFKTVNVTISIGVAARASKQSFEQALKLSDQALYRAKKNGRNNVSQ